jgi:heptosyltransferase-2
VLEPRRILVHAPNPLGDAVMAEPAMRAIAARFSRARLDVLIARPLAALARGWPFVDRIWPVPVGGRLVEAWGARRLAGQLAGQGYGVAVLFPNSIRAARIAARSRVPRVVGHATAERAALLTDAIAPVTPPRAAHMVLHYWSLARALGCADGPPASWTDAGGADMPTRLAADPRTTPRFDATSAMRDAGERLLRRAGIQGEFVAVAPGAAHGSAKRWPADRFGALCRQLARAFDRPCVLIGDPRERALGATVRAHARGSAVDLTGRTDIAGLAGILASAWLFVGNDSGPAHLAAALGRPGVALFGSTSARHSGPVGPVRVVQHPVPCAPCFEPACPLGHLQCLRGIAAEAVLDAARAALEEAGS